MRWPTRRELLAGLATSLVPRQASAKEPAPLPPIPVAFSIAGRAVKKDGKDVRDPVVSQAWIAEQLTQANTIFGEFGIGFWEAKPNAALDERFVKLENRADRDALVGSMMERVLNVFLVESLRDVDDPKLLRMGVMWRNLQNLKKKYVIVAASARTTTLAHEIGHFLGNDHTYVKNNLMSYDRDGGKVTLSADQAARARKTALGHFAKKELVLRDG